MRKLNAAMERFCYNHPRFGIPNLMKYIVSGNLLIYLLGIFSRSGFSAVSFLAFDWSQIRQGELWRLVTFIFVPQYQSVRDLFWLAISLYFYDQIGNILEREWGTAKFSLYYFSGMVLTVLAAVAASLLSGTSYTIAGTDFINMSMFFAFAMLYPDAQILLLIFPVKIKWLALFDAAWFALSIVGSLLAGHFASVLLAVIALANFLIFFWPELSDWLRRTSGRAAHQASPKTIRFKQAARQQARQAQSQGYRHKCCVCGRTDTDYPQLQFRYCSKCAGYHCFCEDHIFNHVHFTE